MDELGAYSGSRMVAERLGVRDRELSENLAVDLDARELEPVNQPAIGQVMLSRGRIDPRNPECSKNPLALFSIPVGVAPGFLDRFASGLEQATARTVITFGFIERAIPSFACSDAPFDSRHEAPPFSVR